MKLEFTKWLTESAAVSIHRFLESVSDDMIVQALERFAEQNPDQYNQLGKEDLEPFIQLAKESVLKRGATNPNDIYDVVSGAINVYLFRRSPVSAAKGEVGRYTPPAVQSPTKAAQPSG